MEAARPKRTTEVSLCRDETAEAQPRHRAAQPVPSQRWETKEGSPSPLGPTWITEERAYNFAIYSKYATNVTLLLYHPDDVVSPIFRYQFDHFRNKTGRVWHARIPRSQMHDAKYYAYSVDGPRASGGRFERHAFDPQKILLDPYARSEEHTSELQSQSNIVCRLLL